MVNIKVCSPTISEETIEELAKTLRSGWFGNGPKTAEFEEAFAKYVGKKYCVALNSGTTALDLCFRILKLRGAVLEGKELITTPLTFVSDAIVGEWHDMDVTFADIDENSLCMDPKSLKVSDKTAIIMPVDSHGRLADIQGIIDVATTKTEIAATRPYIIEDAAHACYTPGVGELADLTMWSFQAVKTLAAGDGGAITTDDESIAKELHKLKWLNVEKTTWQRQLGRKYTWDYEITRGDGIKGYMNDINATIALGQLKRLEETSAKRRAIQARYNDLLSEVKEVKIPMYSHTVQYYTVQCEDRDRLSEHLAEEGVGTSVHFKPLYEMPYYAKNKKYDLPVCDRVWKKLLSLPCHDAMTFDQVEYVAKKVKDFYGDISRNANTHSR